MIALVALVTVLPVSELALSFLNTILTTLIPPRPLPKLALRNGVPDELRTIVAVPTILSSPGRVKELVDALEVRALANHDENLRFALLGDLPDADAETMPSDREVIDLAARSHHRSQRAIWDRSLLPAESPSHMEPIRGAVDGVGAETGQAARVQSRAARRRRHDVRHPRRRARSSCRACAMSSRSTPTPILPLDAGRKLVGTLAHPLNRARFDSRIGPRHRRLCRASAARRHRRGQRSGVDVLAGVFGARRSRPVHDGRVGCVSGPLRRRQLRRQRHLRRRRIRAGAERPGARTTRC